MGMLERDSRQVRVKAVPNVKRELLQREILNEIEQGFIRQALRQAVQKGLITRQQLRSLKPAPTMQKLVQDVLRQVADERQPKSKLRL